MPPRTRLVVSTHQHDQVIEPLWRNRRRIIQALAEADYDLVLVPSFSVWDGRTRLEHRRQIARGIRFYEMLVTAGVPTLPNVSWYLKRDIIDWSSELLALPGFRAFSLDLQTLQTEEKWAWGIRELEELAGQIGPSWEVVVNGVDRADRIRALVRIFGHIHLINARPYELSMSNHMTIDDLLTREIRTDPSARMNTFAANVAQRSAAVGTPALCALSSSRAASRR